MIGTQKSGRHRPAPQHKSGSALKVIVTALALLTLVGGAWGATQLRGGGSTEGTTHHSGHTASATPTAEASNSPAPVADVAVAPTTAAAPGTPAALIACQREVAAGERVGKAATSSAGHWTWHTAAQTRFDRGEITEAQAKAIWAASKAKGPADLKEFAAATSGYNATKGACAKMGTLSTEFSSAGYECAQRATALPAVITSGTTVNGSWAKHQTMMAAKAHTDKGSYNATWRHMVHGAPTELKQFNSALATLNKLPACTV